WRAEWWWWRRPYLYPRPPPYRIRPGYLNDLDGCRRCLVERWRPGAHTAQRTNAGGRVRHLRDRQHVAVRGAQRARQGGLDPPDRRDVPLQRRQRDGQRRHEPAAGERVLEDGDRTARDMHDERLVRSGRKGRWDHHDVNVLVFIPAFFLSIVSCLRD